MAHQFFLAASICLVLLGFTRRGLSQQFDAIIQADHQNRFTIADQIQDPDERKSFLALYNERDARMRAQATEAFLVAYPRSAFLAQAYEIAAKAHIDLENYPRALQYAKESLKLLPENPLLLVPLANLEARMGLTAQAQQSARDALEYLERFARPRSIPEQAWPDLNRQLQASSFFALGRASVVEALKLSSGQKRKDSLEKARNFLSTARTLNPADLEIAFLLGLTDLSLGDLETAKRDFAVARQGQGSLQAQATDQLRRIYEISRRSSDVTFEKFLEQIQAESENPIPRQASKTPSHTGQISEYAGSETCKMCHLDIYRAWSQTGMARMFRRYRPENVIGDFEHEKQFYAADEISYVSGDLKTTPGKERTLFARMVLRQGRHYFDIKERDGQWHLYAVDYTIGSKWQQAYATRLPNGQVHVLPIQYSGLHKRWVNFWKVIDPAGSERAEVQSWERLSSLTNYKVNCAVCHTSQLRNTKGGGFDPDALEFREPGVNCEMCHGPSARHATSIMKGEPYVKGPLDPPVDFTKVSARDYLAICAQCHMQSAVREAGPHGELNYSREDEFFNRYKSLGYAEFSQKGYYKDGRFRQTTFVVESLMRSACFRKGKATCGHCHTPHNADASSNPSSLKFRDQPDQMCVQCHAQFKGREALEHHTRHRVESEGSRCVSCHMPRLMEALLFQARSHQIDDIPNLEMTQRFGREESPNACLLCHATKDVQWVKVHLSGDPPPEKVRQ